MDDNKNIEIRWHGRGGQGAVTSAELLALAAIGEGQYAQAMPSFGPERRGAPVLAFNRFNKTQHIRTRAAITQPDVVVVLDPGLLTIIDVTAGLKAGGVLVINSSKKVEEVEKEFGGPWTLAIINATAIAKEKLGVPIVNTTMIGALVKATGIIKLKSLEGPIKERFGARAQNNIEACGRAYNEVVIIDQKKNAQKRDRDFPEEYLPTWKEILPGAVVVKPGNADEYRTGDWRSQYPEYDYEKCNKCGLCYLYCPDAAIEPKDDGYFQINSYYCKGCGLCAKECPKSAINMVEVS